jgi:anti-anti-sigma regulatory factor
MHRTGHILLLYHSEGERVRVVADWFRAGGTLDEKLLYVDVAGWGVEQLVHDLEHRGFDAGRALESKRLEFLTWDDVSDVGSPTGLVSRALSDASFPGVRMSIRTGEVARRLEPEHLASLEAELHRLAHERRLSTLCQYDARTIGPALDRVLDLHPDWVFEADLSVRRVENVVVVEGRADSYDGQVLQRSLHRMTADLDPNEVLALDLRAVDAVTSSACRALVSGTEEFRGRGGEVRCGVGHGAAVLQSVVDLGRPERFEIS